MSDAVEEVLRKYLNDSLSRKILNQVYEVPGLSIRTIANSINESSTSVWERVHKMVADGILVTKSKRKGKGSMCFLPVNVKELLRPVFSSMTAEWFKYLEDMEVVVSAPYAIYLLGFWRKGCTIV